MKIRLTKETLGLPVGTVLEGSLTKQGLYGGFGAILRDVDIALYLPEDVWEEIPEPTVEDRLREEIESLKAEIARLRSTGYTQDPSQGIERHMTAESHPDTPQGNTEPKYRILEMPPMPIDAARPVDMGDGWVSL